MPGTLVAKRASTMTRPLLSVFTPAASRPSPSVNGTRPIDTSTTSASIDSAAPPPSGGWLDVYSKLLPRCLVPCHLGRKLEEDPLLLNHPLHLPADFAIHSQQDAVEDLDHDHLGAETAPHRAELEPDHASADDEQ